MSKKVVSMVVALIMVLGLVPPLAVPAQAATTSWQDAYADVLNSPQEFYKTYGSEDQSKYNEYKPYFYFSLRDIDKNGIPELIVRWDMGLDGHSCEVYTYSNGIKDLGSIGLQDDFSVSNNTKYPGLFYCIGAYNGCESYGYATIKDNKLTEDIIWQTTVKPSSDGVIYPDGESVVTINNKPLVAEMKKAKLLPTYSISDKNITNVIYNYGKTISVTIKGTAKAGEILTAKVTPSSTKINYQWYADGVAIKKATKSTFKVKSAQIGKTITVKVTGTVSGGKTVSAKSKGVKVIE